MYLFKSFHQCDPPCNCHSINKQHCWHLSRSWWLPKLMAPKTASTPDCFCPFLNWLDTAGEKERSHQVITNTPKYNSVLLMNSSLFSSLNTQMLPWNWTFSWSTCVWLAVGSVPLGMQLLCQRLGQDLLPGTTCLVKFTCFTAGWVASLPCPTPRWVAGLPCPTPGWVARLTC